MLTIRVRVKSLEECRTLDPSLDGWHHTDFASIFADKEFDVVPYSNCSGYDHLYRIGNQDVSSETLLRKFCEVIKC